MFCEYCGIELDGSYTSKRFCSVKCRCGFATKNKRKEINAKVSLRIKELTLIKITTSVWEDLTLAHKKKRVLLEQDRKCHICHLGEWLNKPLTLEYHHKDGNNKNNDRPNVEYICPNCHSQTDNYKFTGKQHSEEVVSNMVRGRLNMLKEKKG